VAWFAHVYTACGAVLALYATLAVFDDAFRAAFWALAGAMAIDSTDGWLARGLRVKERLPSFDGARLDDIVDYLTYVFVPVLIVLQAGLLPAAWGFWVAAAVLLASAYGFNQTDAKVRTTDHFFTGFPSYWNIVALYLYVWRLPPIVNALVLLALAVLVFVPLRYVYPSRTVTLRGLTLALGAFWGAMSLVVLWRLPATDGPWAALSLVFPVYYTGLSLWLHATDTSRPDHQITR
jgi:phosphatidylcholine synthase